MNTKLSKRSRLLVAFASVLLVSVFFFPVWRIDLFAPQYPEGLWMNIWINGLSGEVDVINGLNHYIGMKHISVEMFPEFKYLPYVVIFFILFGLSVAATGSRKLLLAYLGLTVIGGTLAMYDFYRWGYDYGHNLDPKAAIQVPGLSYQPPLFGHKRLLNFDAYSLPDIGGWVVVGSAAICFLVFFADWYKRRKAKKKINLNITSALFFVFSALLFTSCKPKTEPFNYGKDNCHFCKMGIMDPKYGCEVVTKKSKVYKFDDLNCMAMFLNAGGVEEKDIAHKVVINFEKGNDFIDVNKAVFWVSPTLRSPMGANAAAFISQQAAEKTIKPKEGQFVTWETISNKYK